MAEDKYVNQAYLSVTESAANTLTFSKLETGVSIYEKVGWLISRIDYSVQMAAVDFTGEGTTVMCGISVMDSLASVSFAMSAVVDFLQLVRRDYGVAASGFAERIPWTKSFADLPGGGLLIPPNPIYLFVMGAGLVNPQNVSIRMFYTVKSLKAEDFWELVEQRRMIGA